MKEIFMKAIKYAIVEVSSKDLDTNEHSLKGFNKLYEIHDNSDNHNMTTLKSIKIKFKNFIYAYQFVSNFTIDFDTVVRPPGIRNICNYYKFSSLAHHHLLSNISVNKI